MRATLARVALALTVATLAACAHPGRLPPPPDALVSQAEIPGMPGVRYRTTDVEAMIADAIAAGERRQAWRAANGDIGPRPPVTYLAVSGGGDNGAFGAGLLLGWTDAGTRPEFNLVTGISTGALTAPFAFLGPDYDDQLKEVYTTISADDVLIKRGLLAAVSNDAMADNRPLWGTVSRYATEDLLRAIAREHEHGRMLLVATTNLDDRTGVIWKWARSPPAGTPTR